MSDVKELTQKQKLFCEYYIEEWNASESARRAGYSLKTAGSMGSENLKKPEINAYIKELQCDIEKIAKVSRLKILNAYKDIAFSDLITSDPKDELKALDSISKMLGYNDAEKFDITSKGDKIEAVQFYLPDNNRGN
jgi:phage terminase small subunit